MSGSTQSFFEEVEDRLAQAADSVEREARDVANDLPATAPQLTHQQQAIQQHQIITTLPRFVNFLFLS